jgi:hypothetical protein
MLRSANALRRYEDEAFSETFVGSSANGCASSESHEARLIRQRGAQTATQSICRGTPSENA